jgi:hypothetical protein
MTFAGRNGTYRFHYRRRRGFLPDQRLGASAQQADKFSHASPDRGLLPPGKAERRVNRRRRGRYRIEDQMSSSTEVADKAKSEAATMRAFFAIILLVVVVTVAAGFLFGLAGVGAVAIAAAAGMLLVTLALTRM